MAKIKFTDVSIKSLKPKQKVADYYDKDREHGTGSLFIRVSPKGKKVFYLNYKPENDKPKNYKLGVYLDISLKDARTIASDLIADIKSGNDPKVLRAKYNAAPTMNDLWREYVIDRDNKKQKKAPNTIKEEDRKWEKEIKPVLGEVKVKDVTPASIASMLDLLATSSPVSANRLYSFMKIMFKPALKLAWIDTHPMQWIDKPAGAEPPRERVLEDYEIRKLWPCLDTLRPNPRDIFKLCLLTAQRSGEIMSMRWSDITEVNGIHTWTLKKTKNRSIHTVPLSPQVLSILKAREEECEWVFPSKHNKAKGAKSGHAKSVTKMREKLFRECPVDSKWTTHDLRRTARTIMSRLNIKQHIRERVLNHSQGGIVAVYDQYDYLDEKRDALNKLANEIDRICGGE